MDLLRHNAKRKSTPTAQRLARMLVTSTTLLLVACAAPPAAPSPGQIFDPDPGHNFHAAMGEVSIVGLAGHTVCFTTDGSTPEYANGTCMGGTTARLAANNRVTLTCGMDQSAMAIKGIKVAFDWPGTDGPTVQTAAGNFTLDCTRPEGDRDGDGVADSMDNCPQTPNADQADANHNMIGDACEMAGAPDADRDGRPDSMDNCPMVWNVNQADDDRDGIGNVCDPTPRGDAPLPWNNGLLARAFIAWKDELQCSLNGCRNPGGAGSWHGMCEGGGTIDWSVRLSGLRAISTFDYHDCSNTVSVATHDYMRDPGNMNPMATRMIDITLVANGQFVQDTNFSGDGAETGMVTLTGSFAGTVVSHVQIGGAMRAAGSYISVACSTDPIEQEMCAPGNLLVNFVYPDWSCERGGCPMTPAPLTDRDMDGVFDPYDNCPDVANPNQANADFDMLGDACDMMNNMEDADRDGIPDAGDNCPMVANPMQEDTDHDGLGDACDMMMDADTDRDGIIDPRDNCPMMANPAQTDTDMDGLGDACDPTPMGMPTFSLIKFSNGRCLFDDGTDVRSTAMCDAAMTNQRWEVIDVGMGRRVFRSLQSMRCIVASNWAGTIGLTACNMASSDQQWTGERYDQGGFDMNFPMRLHSAAQNYCMYTDFSANVYATQGNCGLAGTESGRKIGIYPGGMFNMPPTQP